MGRVGRGYITRGGQTGNELRANRGRGAGKPGTNRGQTGNKARAKAGGGSGDAAGDAFASRCGGAGGEAAAGAAPETEERRRLGGEFFEGPARRLRGDAGGLTGDDGAGIMQGRRKILGKGWGLGYGGHFSGKPADCAGDS